MATLANMAQSTRLKLGEPRAQRPSGRAVLQAVAAKTQDLFNQLADTGNAWAVDECILTVVNNTADYQLPLTPYFGKVLQVLTYYPQNLGIPQRYVDFTSLNDMNVDWGLPVNVASYMYTDGSPNTAQRIAFYRKGGEDNLWCRVLPMPNLSAQYSILYSVGMWADNAGLGASPVLNQFHPLIETQTAMSLLPQTEWVDDAEENRARRKEFAASLQYDEKALLDGFQRYIRSLASDHLYTRVGAGGSFDR